jgi:hypothetical protein
MTSSHVKNSLVLARLVNDELNQNDGQAIVLLPPLAHLHADTSERPVCSCNYSPAAAFTEQAIRTVEIPSVKSWVH